MKRVFIGLLTCLLAPATGFACSLASGHEWFYTTARLVQETKQILLVKANKAGKPYRPKDEPVFDFVDYEFEVVSSLKGEKPQTYNLTALPFIKNSKTGYGPDCRLSIPGFELRKQYLIFVDSFHPDGYRKVSGSNDPWVKKVEQLISNPLKKVEFEIHNLDVLAVNDGLFKKSRFTFGSMVLGETPWNEATKKFQINSSNSFCLKLGSELNVTFEQSLNTVTKAVVRKSLNKSQCPGSLAGVAGGLEKFIGKPISDLNAEIGDPSHVEGPDHFWAEVRDHNDGSSSVTALIARLFNGLIDSIELSHVRTR